MSKHICIVEAHVRMLDYLYYSCSWYCLYDVLSAYNPSQDNCHHTTTPTQTAGGMGRARGNCRAQGSCLWTSRVVHRATNKRLKQAGIL